MEDGLLKQPLPSVPEKLYARDDIPYSDKEWCDSRLTEEEKTGNAIIP